MSSLVARLRVQWIGNELFFFHEESGFSFDVFWPYIELANLLIVVSRGGRDLDECVVWPIRESVRRKGQSPRCRARLVFLGLELCFGIPMEWKEGGLRFQCLFPYFFLPGDILEIRYDGSLPGHVSNVRERFIELVFDDFTRNASSGIEAIECLWEEFCEKHKINNQSDALSPLSVTMLGVHNHPKIRQLFSCSISNNDIRKGNSLRDCWMMCLEDWRERVIGKKFPERTFRFLRG